MATDMKEQPELQGEKQTEHEERLPQQPSAKNELEQVPQADPTAEPPSELTRVDTGPPYSVFKPWQKKLIVFSASLGAVFSPMSTTIYLPALNSIASDLKVSNAEINLTVTTFLVSREAQQCRQASTEISKDYAGSCAYTSCRILRRRRQAAGLHDMLYNLSRREYRAGFAV